MVSPQAQYHIGIIVDDFDGTLRWLSETAGYRWCPEYEGEQVVATPEGDLTVPMRLTFSAEEPRLEIVQAVPGTMWTPADSGIHHLGYWSDDVDADASALVASGMTLDVWFPNPQGDGSLWAYCSGPGRTRIELVSRAMQPGLEAWFAAGGTSGQETLDSIG